MAFSEAGPISIRREVSAMGSGILTLFTIGKKLEKGSIVDGVFAPFSFEYKSSNTICSVH